ncbi:MAG: LAGLIDADG family homing endonuclease [Rhodomicrobium sp.]
MAGPATLIPVSQQIWESKYRFEPPGKPERSVEDTFARVAKAASAAETGANRKAWERRFLDAMAGFAFIPAGRVLAGAGTERHVTLFNCFVMGEIGDDMGSIFANVREAALTLQQGGGIGHDFSSLRPMGAPVRGAGASASGPVSFMDVWDAMCKTIMSAGSRRGAMMGTLRCDHPDIEAFIEAKADPVRLRNFNLSVLATDAFMEAVKTDASWPLVFGGEVYRTVSARGLWHKIMRSAYDYAEPGVIFIDRVNALNNLRFCEKIDSTNPCVTGDTWIHTSNGPRKAADLTGRHFAARVDGADYVSPEGFFSTGVKPAIHLETVEGYEIKLTPNHRVRRVIEETRHTLKTQWRAAGNLKVDDKIVLNDHRRCIAWEGPHTYDEGYLIGLLVGDGTSKAGKAVLSVWIDPVATSPYGAAGITASALNCVAAFKHRSDFRGWIPVKGRNEYRLSLAGVKALAGKLGLAPGRKTIAPCIEEASSQFYRGFLRGFFDCDGSVQKNRLKGVSVRLAQSSLERLKAVQRMLLRLGIASRIYRDRRLSGHRSMPDGKGAIRSYFCRADHELVISGENLAQFDRQIGFGDNTKSARLQEELKAFKRRPNRERFTARIKSIASGPAEPVYDIQIPGINAFDANGLYVHNCGEQPLPPYGACLLGSVNLAALIEQPFSPAAHLDEDRLDRLVPVAVRLLDNIIGVSRYPLPEQEKEAKAKRRIGLGVTGLADALIMCASHYGSERGRDLAQRWMMRIAHAAYAASVELAKEKGAFPLFKAQEFLGRPFPSSLPPALQQGIREHGIRNGVLTSIAPTGTISLLAGNVSSGIEPVFDFAYGRRILGPDGSPRYETVEDYAVRLFREKHGEAPLTEAFVTAHDLAPQQHLLMQAALQRYVDASISKTVNCPEEMAFEAFETLYLDAYRLELKGCTAYRPNPVTGAVLLPALPVAADAVQPALPLPLGAPTGHLPAAPLPLPRDEVLSGFTYKLKWPGSDHAIYVTINDTVEPGRRRPFEIFINSKNLEHYAWTVALTRMISAIFRRGGDICFVVEELKAVFDPRGGAWMDGKYVPSLLAAIGNIIEQHLTHIGFTGAGGSAGTSQGSGGISLKSADGSKVSEGGVPRSLPASGFCPRCGLPEMVYQEGCRVCRNCGFSTCS